MKTYKVKAMLKFDDGVLSGTLKVKAANEIEAAELAQVKLAKVWTGQIGITITAVK